MERVLLVFYVIFFATGFMGATALILLDLRVRSRLLRPLVLFQFFFLVGTGLLVALFSAATISAETASAVEVTLMTLIHLFSIAVWYMLGLVVRRLTSPNDSPDRIRRVAFVFSLLAMMKLLLDLLIYLLQVSGAPVFESFAWGWDLFGKLIFGCGMLFFGMAARHPLPNTESTVMRPLMRAYGLIGILLAPVGVIEFAVSAMGIEGLSYISLDHVVFLSWNLVSMSGAIRIFRPAEAGAPALDSISKERVREFGLSPRETEMALQIGRGLSNKEIASELEISAATVRTHIYNLYQKLGVRSRVEMINRLRK